MRMSEHRRVRVGECRHHYRNWFEEGRLSAFANHFVLIVYQEFQNSCGRFSDSDAAGLVAKQEHDRQSS